MNHNPDPFDFPIIAKGHVRVVPAPPLPQSEHVVRVEVRVRASSQDQAKAKVWAMVKHGSAGSKSIWRMLNGDEEFRCTRCGKTMAEHTAMAWCEGD